MMKIFKKRKGIKAGSRRKIKSKRAGGLFGKRKNTANGKGLFKNAGKPKKNIEKYKKRQERKAANIAKINARRAAKGKEPLKRKQIALETIENVPISEIENKGSNKVIAPKVPSTIVEQPLNTVVNEAIETILPVLEEAFHDEDFEDIETIQDETETEPVEEKSNTMLIVGGVVVAVLLAMFFFKK